MAKKSYASSVHAKPTKKKERSTWVTYDAESLLRYFLQNPQKPVKANDRDIDYSNIPALTKSQFTQGRRARVGRPLLGLAPRKMVSLKIDPFVLDAIRKQAKKRGKGYQTYIHEILQEYAKKHAA